MWAAVGIIAGALAMAALIIFIVINTDPGEYTDEDMRW